MKDVNSAKTQMLPAVLLSVAFSFMLCLYAPIELYLLNMSDFWFDIYVLVPPMFTLFLAVACLSGIALFLLMRISKKVFSYTLALYFGVFLALYVQGNYLVANLPLLDGAIPRWEDYRTDMIISAIVWLGLMVLSVILLRKLEGERYGKIVSAGSACVTLMLLFTGVVLIISNNGLQHKQMAAVTTQNQFEMSTESNFIVLLVDSVDSRMFDETLQKHEEYRDYFEDFTYYSNAVAGYLMTEESFPFIFSGKWYENERPFDEYLIETYSEAAIFERLEAQGYDMGMYSPCVGRVEDECIYRFSNVKDASVGGVTDYPGFVKLMVKYIGFRYLPYQCKEFCFNRIYTEFSDFRGMPKEYQLVQEHNNDVFYDALQAEDVITLTDEKVFKCIHLEGAHVPFVYNENMEQVEDATYESSVEATVTVVHAYLEHLKKAGVYDNSVIVVMADHGYEENYEPFPRYNALLMIKGVGENKAFEISKAPLSHEDMAEAFDRLLDKQSADDVFDWQEGDERERRHLFYQFEQEVHMEEYLIGTDSRDLDSVKKTGQVFDR